MIEAKELVKSMRNVYGKPLLRPAHYYGASELPMCLKKMIYSRRHPEIPQMINGAMILGKILHQSILPTIIENSPLKALKWHYEAEIRYWDEKRGIGIHVHPDAQKVCYTADQKGIIIEFKTTDHKSNFDETDPLSQCYIMQLNCYLNVMQCESGRIWIYWRSFQDMLKQGFINQIIVTRDREMFEKMMDRAKMVDLALEQGKDLIGPEFDFECYGCSYLNVCSNWRDTIPIFEAMLPATKDLLTSDQKLLKVFNLYWKNGFIICHRDQGNKYFRVAIEDSEKHIPVKQEVKVVSDISKSDVEIPVVKSDDERINEDLFDAISQMNTKKEKTHHVGTKTTTNKVKSPKK